VNWIIDHIDELVYFGIPLLFVVCVFIISAGIKSEPSMMHENEPQGERRWRSSKEKDESKAA